MSVQYFSGNTCIAEIFPGLISFDSDPAVAKDRVNCVVARSVAKACFIRSQIASELKIADCCAIFSVPKKISKKFPKCFVMKIIDP